MSPSVRREFDLARLAARERRVQLVREVLGVRRAEYGELRRTARPVRVQARSEVPRQGR